MTAMDTVATAEETVDSSVRWHSGQEGLASQTAASVRGVDTEEITQAKGIATMTIG